MTFVRHRIRVPSGLALEPVGAGAVLALLYAKGRDAQPPGAAPALVERAGVAGRAPISVRQTDRVAERIDLPFPLEHAGLHVGLVGRVRAGDRAAAEGVGIGVEQDAVGLAVDDARDQPREPRVLARRLQIRPDLRARIAQPHRHDVAGDDEGVGPAVEAARRDGRIERVGEASREHRRELRRDRVRRPHPLDRPLDRGAGEAARAGRGASAIDRRDRPRNGRHDGSGHGGGRGRRDDRPQHGPTVCIAPSRHAHPCLPSKRHAGSGCPTTGLGSAIRRPAVRSWPAGLSRIDSDVMNSRSYPAPPKAGLVG